MALPSMHAYRQTLREYVGQSCEREFSIEESRSYRRYPPTPFPDATANGTHDVAIAELLFPNVRKMERAVTNPIVH